MGCISPATPYAYSVRYPHAYGSFQVVAYASHFWFRGVSHTCDAPTIVPTGATVGNTIVNVQAHIAWHVTPIIVSTGATVVQLLYNGSEHIAWYATPIIVSTGATARSAYATVVQHRMVCETPQNDILLRLVCNSRTRHKLALYGPNLGNISY